jgi:hypothetical protein
MVQAQRGDTGKNKDYSENVLFLGQISPAGLLWHFIVRRFTWLQPLYIKYTIISLWRVKKHRCIAEIRNAPQTSWRTR